MEDVCPHCRHDVVGESRNGRLHGKRRKHGEVVKKKYNLKFTSSSKNLYSPSMSPRALIALRIQGLCYARLRWSHPFVNVSSVPSVNGSAITIDVRSLDIRGNFAGVVNYIGNFETDNRPGKYHMSAAINFLAKGSSPWSLIELFHVHTYVALIGLDGNTY